MAVNDEEAVLFSISVSPNSIFKRSKAPGLFFFWSFNENLQAVWGGGAPWVKFLASNVQKRF